MHLFKSYIGEIVIITITFSISKVAQALLAICAVSEVVGQLLVSFPSSSVPLFHVCVLPILFHSVPPFIMTIASSGEPLPCTALTTAGYWQGPFHCCSPNPHRKETGRTSEDSL